MSILSAQEQSEKVIYLANKILKRVPDSHQYLLVARFVCHFLSFFWAEQAKVRDTEVTDLNTFSLCREHEMT